MTIEIVTPPASEPISLADAKDYLRVDADDEDTLIAELITSARERVEALSGRALIKRRLRERRDDWATGGRLTAHGSQFRLGAGPLLDVHYVRTFDDTGAATLFVSSNYYVDARSTPGRIALVGAATWPKPGRSVDGIEIGYDAGYGESASDAPRPLVEAIRLLLADSYENREAAERSSDEASLAAVRSLIAPFWGGRL